jgi:hypothetical protein
MLLPDDPEHFQKCHERWVKRGERIQIGVDKYPDEWFGQQCMSCRFYIPLVGVFSTDWGVCSNPNSLADGTVRFEHDACDAYEEGEQWTWEGAEVFPEDESGL